MADGNERERHLHNFTLPLNWGSGQRSVRNTRINPNFVQNESPSNSLSTDQSPPAANEMVESPADNSGHPIPRFSETNKVPEELMPFLEDADRLQISMEEEIKGKSKGKVKGKEKVQLHKSVPELPWKLRTRRGSQMSGDSGSSGGGGSNGSGGGGSNGSGGGRQQEEKLNWPKFRLALTREEIESDFIKMTGAKPPRKLKKRSKAVQKKLNVLTPAFWMEGIKPEERYEVSEDPERRKGRKSR